MKRKRLSRLVTAALVVLLLMTDAAALLPGSTPPGAHASFPGLNIIVGLFRTGAALHRRNEVYREAGATAEEAEEPTAEPANEWGIPAGTYVGTTTYPPSAGDDWTSLRGGWGNRRKRGDDHGGRGRDSDRLAPRAPHERHLHARQG
jgi:hypothetical protein